MDFTKPILVLCMGISFLTPVHSSEYGEKVEAEIETFAKTHRDKDRILSSLIQLRFVKESCPKNGWLTDKEVEMATHIKREGFVRGIKYGTFKRDTVNQANSMVNLFVNEFSYHEIKDQCSLVRTWLSGLMEPEF